MRRIFFLLVSILFFSQTTAQRSYGSWQDYLSFASARKVAFADSKVYCATEGGLFYFDWSDNSIQKFTGNNGLSDTGIRTIAWNPAHEVLVVAYENSNIDLVYDNRVVNLADIKRKPVAGDKNIYNVSFSGDEAYFSCGFGIVVLNLVKNEIKDTYFIGDEGSMLQVNDVAVFGNTVYASTTAGILYADRENTNLLDYRNWSRVENIPHAGGTFSHLVVHGDRLLATYSPESGDPDAFFLFNGTEWEPFLSELTEARDIVLNGETLVITGRGVIFLIGPDYSVLGKVRNYPFEEEPVFWIEARSAGVTRDGIIWVADREYGLVRISGPNAESIYPAGPVDNRIYSLYSNEGDLWVTPGGHTDAWNNIFERPRFQLFRQGQWTCFSQEEFTEMEGFFDILTVVADPADPRHIFAGSWGGGLLEFKNGQFVSRFTHRNSILQSALPEQPGEPYTRIGGLDFDSEGNLWITNSEVEKNLLKLSPNGEWESFALPEVANNRTIGQLLITRNDDKWILVPRGHDAYVVDASGNRKKRLLVTSYFNNGENEIFNRMNDVYCIAEDQNGAVWIGTSKGVAVYSNPGRIWETESFYAMQPSLDLGDGLYHPLLGTETVTAIAVDGANRKWIGTRGSGVYLVSEYGDAEINHFTRDNSPLLSDQITDIAIEKNSGEVFIGTSQGLVSYQGEAIGGKGSYQDVYVFPNPVREDYEGPVTITGLIENTDVKITDISGNLVYQTTSLGGQALWDGKNLNGNRVKTGVYLVFCTGENGEKTHIEKLLFIH